MLGNLALHRVLGEWVVSFQMRSSCLQEVAVQRPVIDGTRTLKPRAKVGLQ